MNFGVKYYYEGKWRKKYMENSLYVDFINSHIDEIANYVNEKFDLLKDDFRDKIINKIKGYLDPLPAHYDLEDDGCPYDKSGVINEKGSISLNQTVSNFLEEEYTGSYEATYISGMGTSYNTYGDELHGDIIDIADEIMLLAIQKFVESYFGTEFTGAKFEEIKQSCGDFQDIYDSCIAADFFFWQSAIEFVDIGDMKLFDIVKK